MIDNVIKRWQEYHWSLKALIVIGAITVPTVIFGLLMFDLLFPDEEE